MARRVEEKPVDQVDVAKLRSDYGNAVLAEGDLPADPIGLLASWITEAITAGAPEPNAMVLGTVDADARPWTRTVLCRGVSPAGVVFYTNLESRKGHQLRANPHASATFLWLPLHRQLTVTGTTEPVDDAEADAYWMSRPRGSQLAAWASPQSTPIASRTELEERVIAATDRFGEEVPRPAHWGGLRIVPATVEVWQGREHRLHDRFLYTRGAEGWTTSRLAP